ncbi:PEP-CTERM sorting domain-containing protein [Marinobacter halotolerans]|uniref:PEP-CTERM sorting domain-containing protein n=1 Tax=Marinobacter halotolerans TaxID=1569211 RepID=UPI001244A318|nr:PEP-CTERM sorting domain-containing protein [Marinobacter halotolerans]
MFFSANRTGPTFLLTAVLAASPSIAMSTLLFESNNLDRTFNVGGNQGIISFFEVDQRTNLTSFSIEFDLSENADVNFVIYDVDQGPNSNSGTLLYQGEKSFADDGLTFKQSDALSLFLETGKTYGLGLTTNISTRVSYYFSQGGKEENGIRSLEENQNLTGFSFPEFNSSGSIEIRTQIFGNQDAQEETPPTVSVPEPGTLAMFSLGLIGLGVLRRKKSS